MRASIIAVGLAVLTGCGGSGEQTAVAPVEWAGPPESGEPHLAASSNGRAILTWLEPTDAGHALRLAVRDGSAWSEPLTVVADRDFFVNWADFPSLAELEDGTWVVHWLEKVAESPYAYHVKMALSDDEGASWSEPFSPHRDDSPTEHGFVSIVPWRGGAALIWLDGREMAAVAGGVAHGAESADAEMTLRATLLNPSGDLGDEVLLDGRVCECCQTGLVRSGDVLVAAYRDRSPDEIRNISVVRLVDGAWTEPVYVADDGWRYPGCPVNGPQLAAVGDTVAAAWFTAPDGAAAVYVAFSYDRGASWGDAIRVDGGDPLGRVDLELLPDGRAVVVWLERTDRAADLLARTVRPDGTAGATSRISGTSESRSSGFPRTALVGNEMLVAWTLPDAAGGVRVAALRP